MAVGNGQDLEQALDGAVLARPAVQQIEGYVRLCGRERGRHVAVDVDAGDPIALALERIRAGLAGAQRDLALRRPAAHQHRDVFGHDLSSRIACPPPACGGGNSQHPGPARNTAHASPMRLISHSSSTPEFSFTRVRTVSPNVSISAALALPRLIRKLQCISETWASPATSPRQPAASINCQALWPGGFLKVEPPVRLLIGCVASRDPVILSISAAICARSPGRPWNSACVKIRSSGAPQWR